MLFACSGVAVPSGMACKLDLTRFVTSRRLVDEFNKNRNLDDKLRVGSARFLIIIIAFLLCLLKLIVIILC
jgi:hypothetical protein